MQNNPYAVARRRERQPATIPFKLLLKAAPLKTDDSAVALDISLHGARVRTKLGLVPGECVDVVAKERFPFAIPAHVVWSREEESTHWIFAGLEFLNMPRC
jgi:hypothetical protein